MICIIASLFLFVPVSFFSLFLSLFLCDGMQSLLSAKIEGNRAFLFSNCILVLFYIWDFEGKITYCWILSEIIFFLMATSPCLWRFTYPLLVPCAMVMWENPLYSLISSQSSCFFKRSVCIFSKGYRHDKKSSGHPVHHNCKTFFCQAEQSRMSLNEGGYFTYHSF